ncbi:MAG: hypothetical protein JWO25_3427 [Alphaproteobacteria bacterium]|nr:hypothetical protein [Alphaproteobacteria bacterium]
MATRGFADGRDHLKWGVFALVAACALAVAYVDERFLIRASDPHWRHIEPVKWLLLPHGLFGLTALVAGAVQFSDRIRRAYLPVHRWVGRLYLLSVSIAAPLAFYIGTGPIEPASIRVEQAFQSGLWWLSAAIGFACIRNRQIAAHKAWMMRSYAFTLIFVVSRVPDLVFASYSDQMLSDLLWGLVVLALFVPELGTTMRELARLRGRRRPAALGSSPPSQ